MSLGLTSISITASDHVQRERVVITPGEFSTKITWYSDTGNLFVTSNFKCVDQDTMYELHRVQANPSLHDWRYDDYNFNFLYKATTDDGGLSDNPYKHSLNTHALHRDDMIVFEMGNTFSAHRSYVPIEFKAEQIEIPSWPENSGWSYQPYQSFDLKCNEMPANPEPKPLKAVISSDQIGCQDGDWIEEIYFSAIGATSYKLSRKHRGNWRYIYLGSEDYYELSSPAPAYIKAQGCNDTGCGPESDAIPIRGGTCSYDEEEE